MEKVDGYLKDILNKCKRIQPEYLPIVEVVDYQEKKFMWSDQYVHGGRSDRDRAVPSAVHPI